MEIVFVRRTYSKAAIFNNVRTRRSASAAIAVCPAENVIHAHAVVIGKLDRKEWQKLIRCVSAGDTIIFDSVSRMSRNAAEGVDAYEKLYTQGINLVFLKERHIDTDTYKQALQNNVQLTGGDVDYILEGVNRYMLALAKKQIYLAFEQIEKEVADLHQRTKEGIETARLNGKQIGREAGAKVTTKKRVEAKQLIAKQSKSFGGSLDDSQMMKLTGLARNTYYKYKRELRAGV